MKAREAAFRVVHEVLYKKGYSNIALEQILDNENFDSKDAGFITEIVLGTLRNKLYLEYIIGNYSNMKVKKISPSAMAAMLTGAYQILYLDRTPDSAACNESVKIASKFAGQKVRGFVNAILRTISREKDSIENIFKKLNGMESISIKYSCSLQAVKKLYEQYGEKRTIELLKSMNMPAQTCIRFNEVGSSEANEKLLSDEATGFTKGTVAKAAYYPKFNRPISSLNIFKEGIISIQDEGAQAMVEFVNPSAGTKVLDACASPGGKTVHMACLMNGTGDITACDIHGQRVVNMNANFSRTKFENIKSMKMDMSESFKEFNEVFDTVLIDSPCSGIGTAQRRPEIKLFYKEETSLKELQVKILANCADYVKPGGVLVYGTCTLFKEENREVIDKLLTQRSDFELNDEKTIFPNGKTGGFYMVKLVKKI